MNILKQGLLVLITIGFHAHGATDEFSKAERKRIQTILGYGLDAASIKKVFIHSSAGNSEFEALETSGDAYVKGCAAILRPHEPGIKPEEMHARLTSITTNEFLAEAFKKSGLSTFARVIGSPDMTTVYANMFEVLVAVVAGRYVKQNPHLSDSGRVYKILTPIFKRLTGE